MNVIQTLINDHRLVRVTAADFNGKEWDGRPLEPTNPKSTAEDLSWAMSSKIKAEARGGTDYAWFGVTDENTRETVWAGPGDYLFDTRRQYSRVVVIPGQLMELLLAEKLSMEEQQEETRFVLGRKGPHQFIYGTRTFTEGAIRTLMELAKGEGTPEQIANRSKMTASTVIDGLTALKGASLCKDGQSAFTRVITKKGLELLASNPSVLPG